jgi:predicted RNase H-like HicB family nuclease
MKSAIYAMLEDYQEDGDKIPQDAVTVTSLKVAI